MCRAAAREDRAVTAEPEEIHYELNVDAAAHKVLPVYSVERTDRAVALTLTRPGARIRRRKSCASWRSTT